MYRVLSLFAGIGGFDLGLERTGGFRTVAFCEIDPFCRKVLAKHWPDVPCYEDVRTLTAERLLSDGIDVDCIVGGFPCQDISLAGKGAGLAGERSGLWSEYARLIRDLRPRYIIVENVSALLVRGLDAVLGALASIGYDAWWECVPASALGYPHARDRLWLVAYPSSLRRDQGQRCAQEWRRLLRARLHGEPSAWAQAANDDQVRSGFVRIANGVSHHAHRLGSLGNAVVPEFPEMIGRAILEADQRSLAA
jgi:DNA (cytosine-5)-methyltransferase 1